MKTKQEAVKKIIEYFKVEVTPKNLGQDDEYYKKAETFLRGEE